MPMCFYNKTINITAFQWQKLEYKSVGLVLNNSKIVSPFNICKTSSALNKSIIKFAKMSLRDIQNITAGIFDDVDYNMTSQCFAHGLDRDVKLQCEDFISQWPNYYVSLFVFQVKGQ